MDNPHGIYRIPRFGRVPACVWVEGEGGSYKVAEERYRLNHYTPVVDELPTEREYNAAKNAKKT